MKKLNEALYELEAGVYAEQRSDRQWYITDEQEEILSGPFATLEALDTWRGRDDVDPDATTLEEDLAAAPAEDLVTLREAAPHLGITRQGLEYRRKKGILGVDPVVTGRSTELYSLKALKAVYPS